MVLIRNCSTGAEPKNTVEEKKAVYQIRRPLGLAFVISFVGWENCCRSIFRWTLMCPSLPQSPDLLVFPGHIPPPPHTLIVGLTWTWTMEGSAWLSWPVHRTLALVLSKTSNTQLSPSRIHISLWLPTSLNKHVNSGTTVLLFLGRPKDPFTRKVRHSKNCAVSGLRRVHRARLDVATVTTV